MKPRTRTTLSVTQMEDRIVPTVLTISAASSTLVESSSPTPVQVTVTRDNTSGGLSFSYSLSVTLEPIDDSTADPGETVTLTVQTGTGYEVGTTNAATSIVVDDESPVVSVSSIVDAAEGGTGTLWFTRTGSTTSSLTVSYAVSGTATSGTDFTALSGSVTFAAGEDTVEVTLSATSDSTVEDTETVLVTVTPSSTYGADPTYGSDVLLIADDDTYTGEIGGVLWEDADSDGIRDSGETLMEGQAVSLLDESGAQLFETITDASGVYHFGGLAAGTYYVQTYAPLLDSYTLQDQGSNETLDSDIDPGTSRSSLITLGLGAMVKLGVGVGFKSTELIDPPGQATTVQIRDANRVLVAADGLKVAKWQNAFEENPDAKGKPRLVGPIQAGAPGAGWDFIDRDPDRFNVYVYDLDKWNQTLLGYPLYPTINVDISTTNVAGYAAYNDTATAISLTRLSKTGWYMSDSQILVSNTVDDKYSDDQVGKDDTAPDTTKVNKKNNYDYIRSDRTHLIALGGTVSVKYGELVPVSKTVKLEKVVKVHVTIMRDDTAANNGKLAVKDEVVDLAVKTAREIFAQVGLGIEVVGGAYQKKDPPANLDLSDGLEEYPDKLVDGQIQLSEGERLLLPEFRTPSQTDIEIYYVKKLHRVVGGKIRAGSNAEAFPAGAMRSPTAAPLANSAILNGQETKPFHLAHELIHVLTNMMGHWGKNDQDPAAIERTNLMVIGSKGFQGGDWVNNVFVPDGTVADSRRLTIGQMVFVYLNYLQGLLHDPA